MLQSSSKILGLVHLLQTTSVPYICSDDIKSCMDAKILWPGAMCIMAGIDLLGKCLDGNDSFGGTGKRFCNFAVKYFHLSSSQAEPLYQLRNALLHSFGLISNVKSEHCSFQLQAAGSSILISLLAPNCFKVDLICLHDQFETAVSEYHRDLLATPSCRKTSHLCFPCMERPRLPSAPSLSDNAG